MARPGPAEPGPVAREGPAVPRAAVFLDRDGTLIEDRGHIGDVSQVVFLPGAVGALRRLQEHFLLFLVTNQPGIAEHAITPTQVASVHEFIRTGLGSSRHRIEQQHRSSNKPQKFLPPGEYPRHAFSSCCLHSPLNCS